MANELHAKLRKVLALTNSPVEGEAQAAAAMLAKLLAIHNLEIADLEVQGKSAPGVVEDGHDLGKAAFKWKLDLADAIADHYFCLPLVNRSRKTVTFAGRPDNVESLKMLYAWLIDQIKRISADERRAHLANTGEHIDPLRWQLAFGVGAVSRLSDRLEEMRRKAGDAAGTAIAVHHASENSDYLEHKYGYRADGKETQRRKESRVKYDAERERLRQLKLSDIEAYYEECPWERPLTPEQQKDQEKEDAREAKKRARRKGRGYTPRRLSEEDMRRMEQSWSAERAGAAASGRINLQPFIEGASDGKGEIE